MLDLSPIPTTDLGPKMLACSDLERRFIWAYLMNGGDGAAAARAAGYSDVAEGAKVRAHECLQRDRVIEAMHEVSWKSMRGLSLAAVAETARILRQGTDADRLKAAFGILNRTGFGEKTTVQHHHTGSIELSHTDAALEALSYLKSMSVPREKLIEQFGHSGLARYEKMLEERDVRRDMKVIEHER